jgi:hypothetical protein
MKFGRKLDIIKLFKVEISAEFSISRCKREAVNAL